MTTQEHLDLFKKNFQDYQIICSLGTWTAGGSMVMVKNRVSLVDAGTDHAGRIAVAKISLNQCPIAIVSVYAPAQARERQSFFKDLHLFIPSAKWILIGGDFNCAPDVKRDRSTSSVQTDERSYASLRREFITPLCLTELFRFKHPRTIAYSYHSDQQNFHSRIDLFFGTELVKKNTLQINYVPLAISDHDALTTTLSIPTSAACEYRRWICNPQVVTRESFLPRFKRIWEILCDTADFDSLDWWPDLKVSLVLLLQDEQKDICRESRKELKELQNQYRKYSSNPSPGNLDHMSAVRAEIRRVLEEKTTANTRWQQERSAQSLNLLARSSLANLQAKRSAIPFLDHPSLGRVTTDPEMMTIATKFYNELYEDKRVDEEIWKDLLDGLPTLSDQDRTTLDEEVTVEECLEALRSMSNGRSPGEDGITTEVWRAVFPTIGKHYVRMLNVARSHGRFRPGFLNALLTLLKKAGTPDGPIKNYRPLSLMNVDYKILSKVLNSRLRKTIGNIINDDQTCSIPGRSIHDNIHLIRSIIEYHARRKEPMGLILWDQEKAFDRINHRYLMAALRAFGFGQEFVNWVTLLYTNGTFRIRVNSSVTTPIAFQCGVRQGCSLSASLFIICLEPLLHRIRQNPRIPGLLAPGGQIGAVRSIILTDRSSTDTEVRVKAVAYADDITTIANNRDEERETMEMFDLFNRASGGKTNVEKTQLLWVSDWLPPPRFQTKISQDHCVFLGVPIDTHGQLPRASLMKKISGIRQQMGLWSRINLSYGERCMVMKVFILSGIVYWLSLVVVPKVVVEKLQKMIVSFFWGNKRPKIAHRTLVGRKRDGGCDLPHVQSMIEALRIKLGLQIMSTRKAATWKFYALITTASQLRPYSPRLWSNMTPHIDQGATLFHETADATSTWLSRGGKKEISPTDESIYWQIVNGRIFKRPICQDRVNHLKQLPLFQILHKSKLPSAVLDFWYLLANYAVNTRSRVGSTTNSRQCYLCREVETIHHLFLACSASDGCFRHLHELILTMTGKSIGRSENDIIYLREIFCIGSNKDTRRKVVHLIGWYLHSLWSHRNYARLHDGRSDSEEALRLFRAMTDQIPFDNG